MSKDAFSSVRWVLAASIAILMTAAGQKPFAPTPPRVWNCWSDKDDIVLWRVELGAFSTSPLVLDDKILVGTGDSRALDNQLKKQRSGELICVSKDNGKLIWRATHPLLPKRIHDMMGICSKPVVDGVRVYYQSNRGELVCADIEGFRDGENDGPFQHEEHTAPTDADIIWKLDMIDELGVFKRDAGDVANPLPTPLVVDDLVYSVTGNGASYFEVPKPNAPSFLAVNKHSGKVVWSSNAPGAEICYGQWSSPVFARVEGQPQIIFPGGDGRLYGFEPTSGRLKWKVNCNDPEATRWGPGRRGTRSFFVANPTVNGHMLYVGTNHDFESRGMVRCPLYAVDLRKAAQAPDEAVLWKYGENGFDGTFGSVAIAGDTLFTLGDNGLLVALGLQTGRELWRRELGAAAGYFTSPYLQGGKLLAGTEDGDLFVFSAFGEPKCLGRYDLEGIVTGTPVIEGHTLYITTMRHLWALRVPADID